MTLYTRRRCRLCEEAEDILATFGYRAKIVDVDGDEGLAAAYGLRVPVLEVDGTVVAEGRFDERSLSKAIARLTARD